MKTFHLIIVKMLIYVKTPSGETIPLTVGASDTIGAVKATIENNEGVHIQADDQRLMFDGKELEDGRTVSDHGIKNESTLQLLFRQLEGNYADTKRMHTP
jgi:hypothetical protein